jgi:hypothetical protein
MVTINISIAKFQSDYEIGLITDIFSITVGTEKRVYGKSPEGEAVTGKLYHVVYAVVP